MLIYLQMLEPGDDRNRFEALYRHYRGLMLYIAQRYLQSRQDAEDVVHEAFIKIIEHIEKISDPVCPKTQSLVVIITERKAIDLLRARSRHPEQELDGQFSGGQLQIPAEHPLAAAMARLPEHWRGVLLLRYDNGFDTREIAELLGMKRGAVQRMLHRAKVRLRELLEEEEHEEQTL